MSDHQVWNELGNVYIISNEPEKALTAYKKALELNPESGWTHNNIALSYIRLAEPGKAIEHYQRSIELFDDFADKAEVWHRLGIAYQMIGDAKNTLLAFERATALAPENAEYQASKLAMLEDEHPGGNGSESAVSMLAGVNVAPMVASVPLELKKKLIPISVEEEEENIALDPGVQELMDKLSSVIEREVSESPDEEAPLALDEEDAQATAVVEEEPVEELVEAERAEESEENRSPKWLDFDEEEAGEQPEAADAATEASLVEPEIEAIEDDAEDEDAAVEPELPVAELASAVVVEDALADEDEDESDLDLDDDESDEDVDEDDWDEDDDVDFVAELEVDDDEEDEFDTEYEFDDEDLDAEEDDDHDAELEADEEAMLLKQKAVVEAEEEAPEEIKADETADVMQNATVWGEMGNVFFSSDVYDGALIAYRKALELDGDYGAVMHNLALLYMNRGEYDQAVDLYQKSIELLHDPSAQATSWNNLGNAYRSLGDYENAGEAYRKADELRSEDQCAQVWKCQELLSTKSA